MEGKKLLIIGLLGCLLSGLFSYSNSSFPNSICNVQVNAGQDITVCGPNAQVILQGSVVGDYVSLEWTPAAGLSDPFSLNPTADLSQTTTYTLSVQSPDDVNLITNGDFELGNVAFSSNYGYVDPSSPIGLINPGTYTVITSPALVLSTFPPCDDHTYGNGSGQMMVVNGNGSVGAAVWCQTISVNPNTVYSLSAWVGSLVPFSPAQLQFAVNGVLVGNIFNSSGAICGWEPFFATWNSGAASSAEICIINQNSSGGLIGNNFMLDDIEVFGTCTESDQVTINVLGAIISIAPPATFECNAANPCLEINASASTSGPNVSYNWTPLSGGSISGGQGTPIINVCASGDYQLELTNFDPATGQTCTSTEIITINDDGAIPVQPMFTNIFEACLNELVTIQVDPQPGYQSYFWTHSPGLTIVTGQGTSEVIFQSNTSGSQFVCVDVGNHCGNLNQNCLPVDISEGPGMVTINGNLQSCYGDTSIFSFDISLLTGITMQWMPTAGIEIIQGQFTNSVEVIFTESDSFNLCVELSNDCGMQTSCIQIVHESPDTIQIDTMICLADSILLGGIYPDSSGVYFDTLYSFLGCDSLIISTQLQIIEADTFYQQLTTCVSNEVGLDTMLFGGDFGCDSLLIIETSLASSDTVQISATHCDPDSVGIFQYLETNVAGCDSLTLLTVEQMELDTLYFSSGSCDPAEVGIFEETISAVPCDEVHITTVALLASDTVQISASSCDPDSVGIFQYLETNTAGCDSLTLLTVGLLDLDTLYFTSGSCDPTEVGIFEETISSVPCDEVHVTTVALLSSDTVQINATSCDPDSVGIFQYLETNAAGCDSLTLLTVDLVDMDTLYFTGGSCDPAEVGIFEETISSVPCDEVHITTVALLASDTVQISASSCDPDSVGIFQSLNTNAAGCDSLTLLTVDLVDMDTLYFTNGSCDPAEVGIFEETITAVPCDEVHITTVSLLVSDTVLIGATHCDPDSVGIFQYLETNAAGCDSLTLLTVDLVDMDTLNFSSSSCNPSEVGIFSETISAVPCDEVHITTISLLASDTIQISDTSCDPNSVGIFQYLDTNATGCDSLTLLTVDLVDLDTLYFTSGSCDPAEVGIFTETISAVPCDEVHITSVSLLASDTIQISETSCDPNSVGIFQYLDTNAVGCDSLTLLTVDLVDMDTLYFSTGSCNPAEVGIFTETISAVPCDEVHITSVLLLASDTIQISDTSCDPNSVGIFQYLDTNAAGCDSLTLLTVDLVDMDTLYFTSGSCDPAEVGIFTETISGVPCDEVHITSVSLLASDTIQISDTSCDPDSVGIFQYLNTNVAGCDSLTLLTVDLISVDTFYFFESSCDPAEIGVFTNLSNNGICDELTITTVALSPSDSIYLTDFSCNQNQVGTNTYLDLNQSGCDSLTTIETLYNGYDDFVVIEMVCDSNLVGTTTEFLQTWDGCDSTVITISEFDATACSFQYQILIDSVKCNPSEGAIGIELIAGNGLYYYLWENILTGEQGNGTILSIGVIYWINGLTEGSYHIILSDVFGNLQEIDVELPSVELPSVSLSVVSDYMDYEVSCANSSDGEIVTEVLSGNPPFTISWTDEFGPVDPFNLSAGEYFFELLDDYGCMIRDTVSLFAPPLVSAEMNIQQTSCSDAMNGILEIVSTSGGLGTIQISLDGDPFSAVLEFENLAFGEHQILFIDEFACQNDTTIFIAQGLDPWLELGEDQIIQLGDSITLDPSFSLDITQVETIIWEPQLCTDCLNPVIQPLEDQLYKLTLIDEFGCEAEDEILVRVKSDLEFYIPNAFSPNGDGNNDFFEIFYDSGIETIERIMIYDRWGEVVFESDGSVFWDGKNGGESMNPAVFVYQVWFRTPEGETRMIAGDVTLMK